MSDFGYADILGWTGDALAELRARRGWTEQAIEALDLRYDTRTSRVGIPIRDDTASLLGHLAYDWQHRNGQPKMRAPAGVPRALFPPPETLGDEITSLLLTEGEPDTIAAWSHGLTAVAVPGTAGWQPGYAARFTGRRWTVYIAFDCDASGREAAAYVAATLVEQGADARVVDLDPARDDGYDLTDYLLDYGADALRDLLAAAVFYQPEPPELEPAGVIIEPLRAFLERDLPPAEALIGVARGGTNLLPRYGWVMPWGREGAGKTSVLVDLLFHAAAGRTWLDYPVERPLRIVVIVNEGIPGGLQDKFRHKLERWDGDQDAVLDNLAVYASPWGAFSFRSPQMVEHVQAFALDFGADYVALDPLHTLGSSGAGAPQDTEQFKHVLREFGLWDQLGLITSHHANKVGMVSGDWARHPDTVIRLEKDGKNPATKMTIEKARPADPHELGVPQLLEWDVETFGYTRRAIGLHAHAVPDEEVLEHVYAALANDPGVALAGLLEALKGTPGSSHARVRALLASELKSGRIRNLSTHKGRYALVLGESDPQSAAEYDPQSAQTRIDTENLLGDEGRRVDVQAVSGELLCDSATNPVGVRSRESPSTNGENQDDVDDNWATF